MTKLELRYIYILCWLLDCHRFWVKKFAEIGESCIS
jgi:hypothetical protein